MKSFFRKLFGKNEDSPSKNDVLAITDKEDAVFVSARDFHYSQSVYDRNLSGVSTYEIETTALTDNTKKLYVCEFIKIIDGRLMLCVRIKKDDDSLSKARSELSLSYSMHGESFSVEAKLIKTIKYNEESRGGHDTGDFDISNKCWMQNIIEIILCAEPTRHRRNYGRIVTEWTVYYRIESGKHNVAADNNDNNNNNNNDNNNDDDKNTNYSVTKTIDISEGGFKSIVEKQLTENTRIECIIEVDNYKKSAGTLVGRVIRCVHVADSIELFEMTVQFVEMAETARDFLVNCIREVHPGPVDAEAIITMSVSDLEAFIELLPPRNNGSDLSYEALCTRLTAKGVKFGIDTAALKSLSSKPYYNLESVVARGIPPTHGENAVLTYHVDMNPVMEPKEYENGMVNFKDIGLIHPTKKGAVLVEKTLLTTGTPGTSVTGKIIAAIPGKDKKLPTGAHTVVNEDGTALLSGIDGYISIIGGRINVVNTYVVKGDVHYETGNINHNGIVVVMGDVRHGFMINATGDIFIHGTVESASITSGGSLVVQGGCIGEYNTIEAGVNVVCKFIDGGSFDIRGDLKTTYIINSKIKCGGSVELIGSGIIRNSHIIARTAVKAKCIGSVRAAADKTVIEVGNDPELLNHFLSISRELKQNPELAEEYECLKGQVNELGYGSISVRGTAYEGLRIIIGSSTLVLQDSFKAVRFFRNNDEVALTSLKEQ